MKKTLSLLLVFWIFYSCNNLTENAMIQSENEQLVKRYFEHFNKHEWSKMAGMYVDNADFKDPSLGLRIIKQSRQQVINKYLELNGVFPDLHDEVVNIYPSGDKHIIVEFVSSGTAPDGSKFELPICTIFTIENGMITKDFSYFDNFDEGESE